MATSRECLRQFLNRECIWKLDTASTSYARVYTATTAISPHFKPPKGEKTSHSLNVTLIAMKPKKTLPFVTVYVNGDLIDCCATDAFFSKKVPGPKCLYLIYVGLLKSPPLQVKIPADIASKTPDVGHSVTRKDIWSTSKRLDPQNLKSSLKHSAITGIGKCAWAVNGILCQYFLSLDYVMLCPAFQACPSLSRIINLITRCQSNSCVACYGEKIHVDVTQGFTSEDSSGSSDSCPCILSCAALRSDYAPITGNKTLLSLIFDPLVSRNIVGIRLFAPQYPVPIQQLFCGVLADGTEVDCCPEPWELLQYSDFFSRLAIYDCQILKRACLRSC